MRRLRAPVGTAIAVAFFAMSSASGASVPRATAHDTSGAGAFSTTETIHRDVGATAVATNTVTLQVDDTTNLQGRQEINVAWSGAHPTGGIVADQNSDDAQREEYPLVLLECRGVDSTAVAPDQQLTPETCWTQTWDERYQESSQSGAQPPYRLDEYASSAERAAIAGAPSPLPAACQANGLEAAPVQRWVPFDAVSGQVYDGGNAGCGGEAPESQDVGGSGLPSNETFGVTGTDGTGSAEFDVWNADQNASLGCSAAVACALVAVPIMGISCDTAASPAPTAAELTACEADGQFSPGQLMPTNGQPDLAVSGSLWWSASNWRNRITVPLSFAPEATSCAVTGGIPSIDVYGSELMIQATTQWAPSFCQGGNDDFSFVHVQTGEPQARNLVATSGAEAAFTSYAQPDGYGQPVVNAPVAVTGFAISYVIDEANGQPDTSLKLTPRLLAKLLTESYPADLPVQQEDPDLANNPINITMDPEFQTLNPGVAANPLGPSEAASELVALSSDSDVIEALTTYINDDPTARAWLDGQPDQWGMVVNPAYEGIALPVDQWPLLSTFEPTAWYDADQNDCLHIDPVPFQPLVAAPLASLEDISESMQFAIANPTTVCSQPEAGSVGEKLVAAGRQTVGHRFMIGITPLADNARYGIAAAALQTTDGTFVAPDTASLTAASALLQPDPTTGTWPIPYGEFEQAAGSAAYPGTMVVYAAVPTSGLPSADASEYASLLRFAATTGQTPGAGVGQLPTGYLPMTQADGLGTLAAYTTAAADDVAAQNGQVPPLVASAPTPAPAAAAGAGPAAAQPGGSAAAAAVPGGGSSPALFGPYFSRAGAAIVAASVGATEPAASAQTHSPGLFHDFTTLLGAAFDDRLWTGGSPVVLLVFLSLAGIVCVPLTLREGRRRGRW